MSVQKYNSLTRVNNQPIPYVQINTNVVQNIDNMEAGFVWVYLQSKPSTWDVVKEHIKKHFKLGDRKIKTIFAYLVRHRLIRNLVVRTEDGKRISHHDIEVLNGEEFIKNPQLKELSTKEVSTRSIINPVHNQPGSKCRTIKERESYKRKKNTKRENFSLENSFDYEFSEEELSMAESNQLDISHVFKKFLENLKKKKKKRFIRPEFHLWLLREVEFASKIRVPFKQAKTEISSTVKFWEPGNPDYDRLHA